MYPENYVWLCGHINENALSFYFSMNHFLFFYQFVRPHLNFGDIIYDQPSNESLC